MLWWMVVHSSRPLESFVEGVGSAAWFQSKNLAEQQGNSPDVQGPLERLQPASSLSPAGQLC